MHKKFIKACPVLFVGFLLFACGRQKATPTNTVPPVNETPEPTEIVALASPTVALPDPTLPQPTDTPGPSPEAACTNDATFVDDLTVPDGMHVLLGQTFIKKWSVQNSGTCDWGPDYRLVLVSGDALSASSEVALYPAKAGATVAWEISMTAPFTPGEYTGRWQARDPAGNLFGALVFIKVEAIPAPVTDTPAP